MIVDLDHEASLDPARSGAKASWLARALQAGLPVLPGLVVEAATSRHHMEIGAAAIAKRGSGGARLTMMSEPVPMAAELVTAADSLGDRLVARSSTLLEASGQWAGAFTSYVDIAPDELPKAVAGCWASAFTVSSLEQQAAAGVAPGSIPMAVLIQTSLDPVAGGTARLLADGSILVDGIEGSPAPMLQGWRSGHRAEGSAAGWEGDDLIELIGTDVLDEISATLGGAHRATLANRCEWALTDRVWLLQLGVEQTPTAKPAPRAVVDDRRSIGVARVAARAPGRLGEEMVIPWALAGLPSQVDIEPRALPDDEVAALRDRLVSQVWQGPPEEAASAAEECMSGLLGPEPARWLDRVAALPHPDPNDAGRLLSHFDAVQAPSHASRVGLGRWEPFVASVTMTFGTRVQGTPAAPGLGAGTRADVGAGGSDEFRPRRVVTAPQPVPGLAPLLWDASALVTETGGPAAHLFESARALAIPAVCGVRLPPGDLIVAVDGDNGIVSTIPSNGGQDE